MAKKKVNPDSINDVLKETVKLQSLLLDITDMYEQDAKLLNQNSRSWRDVVKESTTLNSLLNKTLEIQGKLGKEIVKRKSLQEQIAKLENFANIAREKANVIRSQFSEDEKKSYKEYLNLLEEEKRLSELSAEMAGKSYYSDALKLKIRKNLADIQDDLAKKQQTGEMRSLSLLNEQEKIAKKTADNLRDQDKQLNKLNSNVKLMNEKLKISDQLSSSIGHKNKYIINSIVSGSGFVALFLILKEMFEAAFKVDQMTTSIANNLGVSKKAGEAVRNSFVDVTLNAKLYSKVLDKSLLNIQNQTKALLELQEISGLSILYTQKSIQSQIFLTSQYKLTVEEAAALQKIAVSNGEVGEDILMIATRQVAITEKDLGIRFNTRKILQQISKLSGEILAQYKNQPDLLAKAVIEANKLGISLEKAKSMGEYLLNFESSIESELQAEVLVGKSLNFEKARSLALDGKSAEAAKEILKQAGSLNQVMNLNVIARKSLAESMGMTSDELVESVRTANLLNKAGFENKQALKEQYEFHKKNGTLAEFEASVRLKTGDDILVKQQAQLSLQEQFQNSIEKVKELFSSIMSGPFAALLSGMVSFLNNATNLKIVLKSIVGLLAFGATRAITMAIASAFASAAAVPIIGLAAGGIAAIAASTLLGNFDSATPKTTSISDGLIDPSGGITISTPKGQIKPNKDDHLIATPNPGSILGSRSPVMDTKRLEDKLDTMISLLQKGGNVFMDSKKVGTTMGLAYSSFA